MIGNRHSGRALHKADMTPALPLNLEAHSLQCPDDLRAGEVAG